MDTEGDFNEKFQNSVKDAQKSRELDQSMEGVVPDNFTKSVKSSTKEEPQIITSSQTITTTKSTQRTSFTLEEGGVKEHIVVEKRTDSSEKVQYLKELI